MHFLPSMGCWSNGPGQASRRQARHERNPGSRDSIPDKAPKERHKRRPRIFDASPRVCSSANGALTGKGKRGKAKSVAPDLSSYRIASGGFVDIVWTKDRFTALKIMVDRGSGQVFLAVDTEPNYMDTVKPAPSASAIYLIGDQEFGQWSQPLEMTVRW